MKKIGLSIALLGIILGINAQENKIDSTGNVGIGTLTPSQKLVIEGNTQITDPTNQNRFLLLHGNGHGNKVRSYGGHLLLETRLNSENIEFKTNNSVTSLMMIKGTGNIGTTNPSYALDIYGASRAIKLGDSGGTLLFRNNIGGTNEIRSYGLALEIETRDAQDISFNSNNGNSKLVTIKGDGSGVGIGTTNPDMKLTVKGKIHAEEVKIDLSVPAPDYVFKEGYTLRSIEEVEKFIKENSHLPEIPSAKEFKENGVMLARMDMDLLKKIEELTLYTINQQKEIQKLKRQNLQIEKQQKEIERLKSIEKRLADIEKIIESKK